MIDLWYKHALIYSLDVETFQDSDGDGIGDFQGLIRRLDYLDSLGVTCLWLLPFYPSPNRDDGYDITDYYSVDSRLGSLGDFVEFMHQAHERGIRVIVDLVANHTSRQHPWFQEARRDPQSRYRDYYLWSKKKPRGANKGMVFPGYQESIWSYDEEAKAYYYHRFYKHQPDLNMDNPAVREEMCKIMGFWLKLGVSGFRLDAAPFVIEEAPGKADTSSEESYQYLEEFKRFLSWRRGDAVLLGEANVPAEEIPRYFGNGGRLPMLFNFLVNQYLFLSLATGRASPLAGVLKRLPELPFTYQGVNFLRKHDELDLGRLGDEEREAVFTAMAPEENMRLFGRGIRRRLAPMLGGNRHRLELAYSLMFSLPGTPLLRYGDEIGMGDDLSLPERQSVRTPMQWSNEENAGFSSAPASKLARPVISEGEYGYQRVNVSDQRSAPDSLLSWMRLLFNARKECPEFGWGKCDVLESGSPGVFAHRCTWQDGVVIALHNLSDQSAEVRLDLETHGREHLIEVFGPRRDGKAGLVVPPRHERMKLEEPIRLDGYDYCWLRVVGGEHQKGP